jgi:ankyrin repeat protein
MGVVDRLGRTPLRLAVEKSYIVGAEILLKHGADVDRPAHDGKSPLAQAILKGHAAMVRILLNHGAKLDEKSLEALQVLRNLKRKQRNPSKKSVLARRLFRVSLLVKDYLFKLPRSSRKNPLASYNH